MMIPGVDRGALRQERGYLFRVFLDGQMQWCPAK